MIHRSIAPHLLSLALLGALVLPLAAARSSAEEMGPYPGERPAPTLIGKLELSLADAIAMGLENNLDVRVNRFDPVVAYEESRIAWAPYDPQLSGDFGKDRTESPNTFSLNLTAENVNEDIGGSGGLSALVPFLNARLGVQLTGTDGETNNTLQALSPELRSDLTFTATVPLMRDLVWNQAWTQVQTSHIGYGIAVENFRRQVMDVVGGVEGIERAYWALIATQQQVEVQQATLETNRAQLEQVQTQYEVGVVSKVEVVEAQAGVSQAEFDLIVAENRYRNAQDQLIDRILGVQLTPESRLLVEPTDDPADYIAYEIDVEASVRKAFANRPELVIAEQQVRQREVELKFAKNQRLPQFDFQGSYGYNGVAGEGNVVNIPGLGITPVPDQGGFGDTFDNYFSGDGALSWSARGVVTIPLGNIAGRHGVTQSKLQLRRAATGVVRERQRIILEVRTQARNLRAAMLGIEAAQRNVDATAEQLRAEQVRLEHGESTPFEVLQRQEEFVRAQSQLIFALQEYQNSITGLNRAQGTTLSARNIVIDDVGELR